MNILKLLSAALILTVSIALAGCAGMSRADKGTVAGAAIGGTAVGLATDSVGGALVGAAGGAIVGRAVATATE